MNQRSATETDKAVGVRLRVRRIERGLSQEALADRLGITFQQIQKYERGRNRISAGRLADVASALDVPITYFYEADGEATGAVTTFASVLEDPEARRLFRAFARISTPELRRKAADLVQAIVAVDAREPADG